MKNFGRIEYIEPNDLHCKYNSIPEKYEDYGMFVDLEVFVPSRKGPIDSGEGTRLKYSTADGTMTFMGGTNGKLTTNYSDINLSDDQEKNTNECIGIESIHMSYDKSMIPLVDVKFIDVRGGSFFSKQENAYVTSLKTDNGFNKNYGSSFMAAVFSMPSPMFTLTIKGYYGCAVKFRLDRTAPKINFNAETGNFELTVQFIGQLFGVYADLPMIYIVLAPYLEAAGVNYWKSRKFTYDESNAPMNTFVEFRKKVAVASGQAEKNGGNEKNREILSDLKNRSELINDIESDYDTLMRNLGEWGAGIAKYEYFLEGSNIGENSNKAINLISVYETSGEKKSEKAKDILENIKSLKSLCEKFNEAKIENLSVPTVFSKILENNSVSIDNLSEFIDQWPLIITSSPSGFHVSYDRYNEPVSVEEVFGNNENVVNFINEAAGWIVESKHLSKDGFITFTIFTVDDGGFKKRVLDIKSSIDKKLTEKSNEIETGNTEEMINLIGFKPTVWNYFKMIFAHIDTFVSVFYEYLGRVSRDKMRLSGNLRLNSASGVKTDIPQKVVEDSGSWIPPFPILYNTYPNIKENNRSSIIRPGDMYAPDSYFDSNSFKELEMVDAIYSAINNYSKIEEEIEEMIANTPAAPGEPVDRTLSSFIPTTVFDLFFEQMNVYGTLLNSIYGEKKINEYVDPFFILRNFAFQMYLINTNKTSNSKTREKMAEGFGMYEAINFYRSHPKINELIKNYVRSTIGDDTLFQYLFRDKNDSYRQWSGEYNAGRYISFWPMKNKKKNWEKTEDLNNFLLAGWYGNKSQREGGNVYFPIGFRDFIQLRKDTAKADNFSTNSGGHWVNISNRNENANTTYISDGNLLTKMYDGITSGTYANGLAEETGFEQSSFECNEMKYLFFEYNDKYFDSEKYLAFPDKENGLFGEFGKIYKEYEAIYNGDINSAFIPFISCTNIYSDNTVFFDLIHNYTNTVLEHSCICLEDMYKVNKSRESRAYMFIMSIPFKDSSRKYDSFSSETTRLQVDLLREGAFWWRYKKMDKGEGEDDGKDPIILPNDDKNGDNKVKRYKHPGKDEFFQSNTSLGFLVTDGDLVYVKCKGMYKYSENRREVLSKYFQDWAVDGTDGFLSFSSKLENEKSEAYITGNELEDFSKDSWAFTGKEGKKKKNGDLLERAEYINPNSSIADALKKLLFTKKTFVDLASYNLDNVEFSLTEKAYSRFKGTLMKLYSKQMENKDIPEEENVMAEKGSYTETTENEKDFKLQIYLTLKRLYERHFCGEGKERWRLDNRSFEADFNLTGRHTGDNHSDFDNFLFVDTYYNDIRDDVMLNTKEVCSYLGGMTCDTTAPSDERKDLEGNTNTSVEQFMAGILQESNMSIKAFPLGNAMMDMNSFTDMFKASIYSDRVIPDENFFLCILNDEKSNYLNISDENGEYLHEDDGFDIADSLGNPAATLPEEYDSENGYKVPAFGVSFGKGNQSYFYGLTMNMDTYKDTEPAIQARFDIAKKGSEGPRETSLYGQNIYSVYSNYSYQVRVECIGNVQIMPSMLFQLNNVPMFKGAYLIQNVEHNITPGNMTTSFLGTRIRRYNVPLVKNPVIFPGNPPEMGVYDSEVNLNNEVYKYKGTEMVTVDSILRGTPKIDVPVEHMENIKNFIIDVLDKLFKEWDEKCMKEGWAQGLTISSGYRSKKHNEKVGGSKTSAHLTGNAVDMEPVNGKANELAEFIIDFFQNKHPEVSFDQILDESKDAQKKTNPMLYEDVMEGKADVKKAGIRRWVHLGYKNNQGKQRRQYIRMHNDQPYGKDANGVSRRFKSFNVPACTKH